MRLSAEPPEQRAVPGDDVVGVEAVEPGRLRAPDERRVTEHAHALELGERLGPVRRGIAVGVVHVEVGDAGLVPERRDVLRRRRRRAAAVRLEVDRDPEPVPLRRLHDERQPVGLGRPRSPPGHDHRRDARAPDLAHVRGDDLSRSTTSRGRGSGSTASRGPGRRRARRTSAPSVRPARASSTRGSRRSPPRLRPGAPADPGPAAAGNARTAAMTAAVTNAEMRARPKLGGTLARAPDLCRAAG